MLCHLSAMINELLDDEVVACMCHHFDCLCHHVVSIFVTHGLANFSVQAAHQFCLLCGRCFVECKLCCMTRVLTPECHAPEALKSFGFVTTSQHCQEIIRVLHDVICVRTLVLIFVILVR